LLMIVALKVPINDVHMFYDSVCRRALLELVLMENTQLWRQSP